MRARLQQLQVLRRGLIDVERGLVLQEHGGDAVNADAGDGSSAGTGRGVVCQVVLHEIHQAVHALLGVWRRPVRHGSIHLSIVLSIYRSVDRSIYKSIDMYNDLSVYRAINQSVDLSIYRSIDRLIYL